jgi:CDP-diacylglycerol--glycerol-3-phosphate 3-phosphatidyltransferase
MKWIANTISIARIFLILTLFFIRPLSVEFFVIYIICGISDMLDGYVARKLGIQSKFGEKLDSAADLIMVAVLISVLYPIINIPPTIAYWIVAIVIIRMLSIIIVLIKYKTFGILHTVGNKVTGLMLFLFPIIIQSEVLIYLLCATASISALEELFIHILSKEFNGNQKSIFH